MAVGFIVLISGLIAGFYLLIALSFIFIMFISAKYSRFFRIQFKGDGKECPTCFTHYKSPYVVPNENYCILCGHNLENSLFFIQGFGVWWPSIEITPNNIVVYKTVRRDTHMREPDGRVVYTYETVKRKVPVRGSHMKFVQCRIYFIIIPYKNALFNI